MFRQIHDDWFTVIPAMARTYETAMAGEGYVTSQVACKILGIPYSTFLYMSNTGKIPVAEVGLNGRRKYDKQVMLELANDPDFIVQDRDTS